MTLPQTGIEAGAKTAALLRAARLTAVVGALYLGADLFMNHIALGDGWAILWPLNGISIGLLLVRPRSDWPALLLGIALGTGIGERYSDNLWLYTIAQRAISISEVLICALILPRFHTLDGWLRSPKLSVRFCSALILGPGISGLLAAFQEHLMLGQPYWEAFNGWATADALGIAATLPLVLSLRTPEMRQIFRRRALLRTLSMLALAYGTICLIFVVDRHPLLFLLYPVLLFVDLMLTFVGASIANVGVCLLAVYLTVHHPGPFIGWSAAAGPERNLSLQVYLGFHMIALLPASIVLLERRWMTERLSEANAQLTLLASLDGLTVIANLRTFDERLAREWNAAIRDATPIALIMVDIDRFKLYNDHYGHLGGDACLRTVAGLLSTAAKRPRYQPARYGGEEFVILLANTTLDGAFHQAESLRASVFDEAIEHRGSKLGRLTLSVGCASARPCPGEACTTLVEEADKALYQAKQQGRNRVVCVSSGGPVSQPHEITVV